jgi:hypothetical protein
MAAVVLPSVALIQPAIPGLGIYILASLLVLGGWDDRRSVHVRVRFAVHALAALLMVVGAGLTVESLGRFSGWSSLDLGVLSGAFTVFVTVGLINAFNMLDGMDGLLGGAVLAVLGVMGLAVWQSGGHPVAVLPALLAVALLAFLAYNFPFPGRTRASVFLGDVGSSDVDVMVIGSASFESVVETLTRTRGQLRRDVNPVVMTRSGFQTKYRDRDRFVSRIAREPETPVSLEKLLKIGQLKRDVREIQRLLAAA